MKWKHVESKQSPELVDATSCPGKIYVRKGIREETRELDGETGTMFVYQEALMSPDEYQSYSGQKIESTGTTNNQEVIMGALADIVDMLLDMQM